MLDICRQVGIAVMNIRAGEFYPHLTHERVKSMYSWEDVATRTEVVYRKILGLDNVECADRLCK